MYDRSMLLQTADKFCSAPHYLYSIVNQLKIPGKNGFFFFRCPADFFEKLISLFQHLTVLLQIKQIHRIYLTDLHIHEFSSFRRTAFDQRKIFRRKHYHMKTAKKLIDFFSRIPVDSHRLTPIFTKMDLDLIFFIFFIPDLDHGFILIIPDTFFIKRSPVGSSGGAIIYRFKQIGLSLSIFSVYDINVWRKLHI